MGAIGDLMKCADLKPIPWRDNSYRSGNGVSRWNLSGKQLEEVSSTSGLQALEPVARYRMATLLYDEKNWPAAQSNYFDYG